MASMALAMVLAVYMPPQDPGPCPFADGLENGDYVHRLVPVDAGQDGASVDKDGRPVEAGNGDHAARHVLVATADGHQAVKAFRTCDRFNAVRNDLAGHQAVAHTLGPHADAVRNRDGTESHRLATGFGSPARRVISQLVNMDVAGSQVTPGRGNADLRLLEIFILEPDSAEHPAARGTVESIDDRGGMGAFFFIAHGFQWCEGAGQLPALKNAMILLRMEAL
jgi:hypothetical protein